MNNQVMQSEATSLMLQVSNSRREWGKCYVDSEHLFNSEMIVCEESYSKFLYLNLCFRSNHVRWNLTFQQVTSIYVKKGSF